MKKDLLHIDNELQLQDLDFVCSADITDEFCERDLEVSEKSKDNPRKILDILPKEKRLING